MHAARLDRATADTERTIPCLPDGSRAKCRPELGAAHDIAATEDSQIAG
jgi:hypothetical protein